MGGGVVALRFKGFGGAPAEVVRAGLDPGEGARSSSIMLSKAADLEYGEIFSQSLALFAKANSKLQAVECPACAAYFIGFPM